MATSSDVVYTTNTIGGKVSDGFDDPMEEFEFDADIAAYEDEGYDEIELAVEDDYYGSDYE